MFIYIMHVMDALGLLDNNYPIGFHNIIVYVFEEVLEDRTMFSPRYISQIRQQLLLNVISPIHPNYGITFRVSLVYFSPSPYLIYDKILICPGNPLVTSNTNSLLLANQQKLSVFLRYALLIMRSVCLTLRYNSNSDVISRYSNILTIRSCITLITAGPS